MIILTTETYHFHTATTLNDTRPVTVVRLWDSVAEAAAHMGAIPVVDGLDVMQSANGYGCMDMRMFVRKHMGQDELREFAEAVTDRWEYRKGNEPFDPSAADCRRKCSICYDHDVNAYIQDSAGPTLFKFRTEFTDEKDLQNYKLLVCLQPAHIREQARLVSEFHHLFI